MKYKRGVFRNLALISQLGFQMIAPVLGCIFVAVMLEKHLQIKLFLPLLILGFLAGGRNMYMLANHSVNMEKKEDEEEEE